MQAAVHKCTQIHCFGSALLLVLVVMAVAIAAIGTWTGWDVLPPCYQQIAQRQAAAAAKQRRTDKAAHKRDDNQRKRSGRKCVSKERIPSSRGELQARSHTQHCCAVLCQQSPRGHVSMQAAGLF